MVGGDK